MQMKRRAFLAGAAALAASPALPVGPVGALEVELADAAALASTWQATTPITMSANRVFWFNASGVVFWFDCTDNPENWTEITYET